MVQAALAGGARAVQLRDKSASGRELAAQARALHRLTRPAGALLFVNDRVDVALAVGAEGVHLGPEDLPVAAVRRCAGGEFLIGASTDDPQRALRLAEEGADYIGCGAVFGTTSKEVGDEAIGLSGLARVARAAPIPVVGIGGVTPDGAVRIARTTGSTGVAVIGAVMTADDPEAATRALIHPFEQREE